MVEDTNYVIQYSGLAEENHDFSFYINKKFFEDFEYSVIQNADIELSVSLEKSTRMMIFYFQAKGEVELVCDRCNGSYNYLLNEQFQLIAKIVDEIEDNNNQKDEIIFLHEDEFEIDLKQHFFDFIVLKIPLKKNHSDSNDGSQCDQEVIRILEDEYSDTKEDPRWNELKKLKLDKK